MLGSQKLLNFIVWKCKLLNSKRLEVKTIEFISLEV